MVPRRARSSGGMVDHPQRWLWRGWTMYGRRRNSERSGLWRQGKSTVQPHTLIKRAGKWSIGSDGRAHGPKGLPPQYHLLFQALIDSDHLWELTCFAQLLFAFSSSAQKQKVPKRLWVWCPEGRILPQTHLTIQKWECAAFKIHKRWL